MKKERTITVVPALKSKIQKAEEAVGQRLRVAAYARVSTEQDEQESSYEAQVDFYTRHIQSNPNWEFVGVFADRGITGTNTKNRESFNRMISLALEGGIDLILTKSISRFARNTVDTLQTVRELKGVGVEVVFEKENLHTLDPKCEVMLAIMSSLAQEESRSISENVRWGQQKSMRDGKVFLPYKHFLGYKKGADGYPEIVEEEAAIVRQIYDMFLSGKSIRHIADYLTEQGVPTPTGKSRWPVSTVENTVLFCLLFGIEEFILFLLGSIRVFHKEFKFTTRIITQGLRLKVICRFIRIIGSFCSQVRSSHCHSDDANNLCSTL